jgi:hypothetical protein
MSEEVKDRVAFELVWGLQQGRMISWKTTVAQDIAPEELDALLDKLRLAIDRQVEWAQLRSIEALLIQQQEMLDRNVANLDRNKQKYPDLERVSADVRRARADMIETIQTQMAQVELYRAQMSEIRTRLNGAGNEC